MMNKIINYEQILNNIYEEATQEDKLKIGEVLKKIQLDGKITPHLTIYIAPLIKKYRPDIFSN